MTTELRLWVRVNPAKAREKILGAYKKARGYNEGAGKILGVSVSKLYEMIGVLKIKDEIAKIRKEAAEEGKRGHVPHCSYCGKEGHFVTTCEEAPTCSGCGDRGHSKRSCEGASGGSLAKGWR